MAKDDDLDGPIKNRPLPDEKIDGEFGDILKKPGSVYDNAIDADKNNRDAAIEDLKFYAGDQWDEIIEAERLEDQRPILTINRLPQFVNQVTARCARISHRLRSDPPDEVADPDIADIYSGLIRHIEYASDASSAYQTGADAATICGIGHFRIVTEYSEDDTFDQNIRIRRIRDTFSVTWDPHAAEPTRSDARYCFVEESMDKKSFKARYPDARTDGWDHQSQTARSLATGSVTIRSEWRNTGRSHRSHEPLPRWKTVRFLM